MFDYQVPNRDRSQNINDARTVHARIVPDSVLQHFTYDYKMLLDFGSTVGGLLRTFDIFEVLLEFIFTALFINSLVQYMRNNVLIRSEQKLQALLDIARHNFAEIDKILSLHPDGPAAQKLMSIIKQSNDKLSSIAAVESLIWQFTSVLGQQRASIML